MRYQSSMNFQNFSRVLAIALLVCFAAACGNDKSSQAASAPSQSEPRNADTVINGMRLRSLTKELELTDEQKDKVQVLFDEESKEVTRLYADTNLSVTERLDKIGELKKETYAKIKPLLTPAQAQKFDEMLSKSQKRKKKS